METFLMVAGLRDRLVEPKSDKKQRKIIISGLLLSFFMGTAALVAALIR